VVDNVPVKPSAHGTKVPIAVDTVGTNKFPLYKQAFGPEGEATLVGENNPLPVMAHGHTSTDNTTIVALGSGATYTGTGELTTEADVMVSCFSDTDGTLYFDFSVNGTDWRTFPTNGFTVVANIHEFHVAVKGPRYFRARFVNSASVQSTFQLSTYYGTFRQPNAPLNQPLGLDSDAILVRPIFPWLDVVRGLTTDVTHINKFGHNVDCATGETIWSISTAQTFPTEAATVNVVSSSTNDDVGGSHAEYVLINGIDANYDVAEEVVALDGQTNSASTGTWWFINTARVCASDGGRDGAVGAEGNITMTQTGTGTPVMAYITAGHNRTEQANYMVPRNHTGWFNKPQVTMQNTTNNSVLELEVFRKNFNGADEHVVDFVMQGGSAADYQQKEFGAPLQFGPKDIIYWYVSSTAAGGTFNVTVDYDIWLVKET